MNKKCFAIILLVIMLLIFTGCSNKKQTELTDADRFKEEYEGLNGQSNTNGKEYRSVEISDSNPFVYASAEEIVEKIDNQETFAVYFGFKSCPWCRSIISTLIEVAKDNAVNKIYYVDVIDIRDTLEINDKGEVVTSKKGTDGYYQLLEKLDNVLNDYTLTNKSNKTVKTGEKRIYAPNVVTIVKGEAKSLESGISEKQTDAYQDLTKEMVNETYSKFEKILEDVKIEACSVGC